MFPTSKNIELKVSKSLLTEQTQFDYHFFTTFDWVPDLDSCFLKGQMQNP